MITPMIDHYAVVGNPISHSKSPFIHRLFAEQTGQEMHYRAELGDPNQFESQVLRWMALGLRGLNVTLPFKERALALATHPSFRAQLAGAANTLRFVPDTTEIEADNTDGVGLMRDLQDRLGIQLKGKSILVLGAGGATRGILGPLLEAHPQQVVLTNRTESRGIALVSAMQSALSSQSLVFLSQSELVERSEGFDLVINATSSSLSGAIPDLPPNVWVHQPIAYDLAYAPKGDTAFMSLARERSARQCSDGLGMLVEQAAEAFYWWRGIRPETDSVLFKIRNMLATQ